MNDVLVIGAGPAGIRVASLLAQKGYRVTALEEHPQAGDGVCCTGIVGAECFSMLPISPKVLRVANSATFVSPGGKTIRLVKDSPQAYVLDRQSLDRSLAQQAESHGVKFVYGCSVENCVRENGFVEVDSIVTGERQVFRGHVVVLATGVNPGLISRLGVGGIGDFALGAQVEVEVQVANEVEVGFSREYAPGFFTWIVPIADGKRALIGLMCREKPKQRLGAFLKRLQREGKILDSRFDISCGRIPLKAAGKSYADQMIAVGDAAGQVKPTTGGGIYYGLLCAEIAADVIDKAFQKGDLSSGELAVYHRRWKKLLDAELSMGYLSRQVFERLGDKAIDGMFDIVQRYSLDKMALSSPGFSFDWHGGILRRALSHTGVQGALSFALSGLRPKVSDDLYGDLDRKEAFSLKRANQTVKRTAVDESRECGVRS